jgi:hypothetical protein
MKGLYEIIEYLEAEPITEEEVWELARLDKEIPCFENILIGMTMDRLEYLLTYEKFPYCKMNLDIDKYVNCADSYFEINGEDIFTLKEFKKFFENFDDENIETELNQETWSLV